MTTLNDKEIRELCIKKDMINPFLSSRKKRYNGALSYGLSHIGYDIRIGKAVKEQDSIGYVDPTYNTDIERLNYKEFNIEQTSYILKPNSFVLVQALETFKLPENIYFEVKDKSTLARLGLAVQNTVAEPNWHGDLVLEITNHGQLHIHLSYGMPIAQLVFHKVETPEMPYNGRYQGQKGCTTALTVGDKE